MMPRRSLFLLVLALVMALLSACASTAPEKEILLRFPGPPDDPKIAYIKTFKGEAEYDPVPSAISKMLFGTPVKPPLQKPYGVFAQGGKIYTTLTTGGYVVVFDTKERKVRYLGEKGDGQLATPLGVAGTSDGSVYVSDVKHKQVFAYNAEGDLIAKIGGNKEITNPAGLAVSEKLKRLYIADSQGHKVLIYSLEGKLEKQIGAKGNKNGEFNVPSSVVVDRKSENILVVDSGNFRVQIFDKDGNFLRKFGEAGDRPGMFGRPRVAAMDTAGNIYITDATFNNFQIFNDQGEILGVVGRTGRGPGQFTSPAGIFIDDRNAIYVVDSVNGWVHQYQYLDDQWKEENAARYDEYLKQEPPAHLKTTEKQKTDKKD